ncbi:RagB/SusD family nutrient uptake outer membrane protein [Flavisolibacter ginsenosidimutans]|uniref:RagB/SusD family nutrient uptake outer membrane protein n=1 Tax=Flavisolibacter ginsenosidimutans TaxID=661481 RepID=A0A5B8UHP9_9BACT|nr:RagB/SusD family nutrient uptake outer membrane protein [Flavisolibacter ginsenosidimutans]QEC56181.1 RagB/SusD family nutrient uptake outer membrane protein [Flavisolibacter ginsenosidimutans]
MKKKLIIFIGICISLPLFFSCKKNFLKEDVYSSLAPETLGDSLGIDASIIGLYNHLSTFFSYSGPQGWPSVWHAGTDVAFVPPSQKQGIEVPYYDYTQLNSTDGAASYTWSWAYRMISNANIIIKNADAVTGVTAATKASFSAEARFFRGYAYNILATCFGKVPLVTEPTTTPRTNYTRNSLDEVNNLIIQDLTFAVANLSDVGGFGSIKNADGKPAARANKWQAAQLLAEVYLRANKPDLAEQQTAAIINSGKFALTNTRYGIRAGQPGDPFSDMFIYGNERRYQGNKEAIWVMEEENINTVPGGYTNAPQQRRNWGAAYYQVTDVDKNDPTKTVTMIIADSLGGRGIARMRLTDWVAYGLYENNDMRNSQYNIRRRYYYNNPQGKNYGLQVPYTGPDTLFKIAPNTTKWYDFIANNVDGTFGFAMTKDFILMRLGETYLLQAEAQFKQGKLAEAAASINALRTRAGASQVTAAQINLDFILDERARELLAEENRRMTLMRTGTLVARTQAYNKQTINPVVGLTSKNLLLPIPQSEIDLNKDAVLEQNPGY